MNSRHVAFVIAMFVLLLPLYGLAHEVGLPKQEQKAHVENSAGQAMHADEGIEAHIEEALEAKLAPIRAELAEIHAEVERPGIGEIVGGIGWIIGILGIAAYLKSRRK